VRVLLVLFSLLCSVAAAEPPEERARSLAAEGRKAFEAEDYALAIERYEAAYQLKPAPGLLFNIGQCHRKAGRYDEALGYFRRYLDSMPPQSQAKVTEEVIAEVEAQRYERLKQEAAERTRQAEELRVAAARAEAELASQRLAFELSRREAPPTPLTQRWYLWAGVAAVVIAGAVTATAVATAPRPAPTTFPDINAR
jgi:tetratricopeptide (TPR) repeat protein